MALLRQLLCCFAFQLAISPVVRAQAMELRKVDSLRKTLLLVKEDSGKVKILNEISFTYFSIDPAEGIRVGEQARALAGKLKWEQGLAGAYHALGANYWASHQLSKTLDCYWQGLQINERLGDKRGIAKSLHNLATTYESQYNYPKAIGFYEKALAAYVQQNDTFSRLGVLANLASVYEIQKNFDLALNYYNQSLEWCKVYGNPRHIAYMSGQVGNVYALKGEYRKALFFELRSLETLRTFSNRYDVANVLASIGDIYRKRRRPDSALNYYLQAYREVDSATGTWTRTFLGRYAGKAGGAYLAMGDVRHSILYLKKAIDIALSVGDKESLRDNFEILSSAQAREGNVGEALSSYKRYILYKDSLTSADHDREMTRHELEYEYGKEKDSLSYVNGLQQSRLTELSQQQELTRLQVKQQWLYGLIALVLIGLGASLFVFRYHTRQLQLRNELRREKTEKQLKDAEYQRRINEVTFSALRSQMNPHFIFNALNTIQSFVYSNDKASASQYLGKFSELIRKILDDSGKDKITLTEEIDILRLYVDIEKARFGDAFQAKIEIDPHLNTEEIQIPPLLIQPFAENAIKHGLLHLGGEKRLRIMVCRAADPAYVDIIIDDNGIGRVRSIEINKLREGHYSFANAANQQRIDLINQMQEKKTRLEIIDKEDPDGSPAGTTVIISIPAMTLVGA